LQTGVVQAQSNEAGLSIDLGSSSASDDAPLATSPTGNLEAGNQNQSGGAISREDRPWRALIESGDIARVTFTNADIAETFPADVDLSAFRERPADGRFFEVYTGMVTPDGIGRNVYGQRWQKFNMTQVSLGDHIVLIAAFGKYRVLGSGQTQSNNLSNFERVAIVQNGKAIALTRDMMLKHNAVRVHGAPRFKEQELFRLRPRDGFDPFEPWSLRIEIRPDAVGAPAGTEPVYLNVPYRIPAAFVMGEDYALEEAGFMEPVYGLFGLVRVSTLNDWQMIWLERRVDIAILAAILGVLTIVLVFQHTYVRNRRIHAAFRFGFLVVILVWLGWAKDAQLTSINIITYFQAAFADLDPVLFLLDPLIFLLSVYAAITLILWGRGVYCGWLCPFGAFQEILAKIAQWLKVPQITVPETLQDRLWAVKYVAVFVVFGLALFSMEAATKAAEVEPFKTAIIVGFDRSWPYLLYTGILLAIGLTIERFFCRFLCPLGGALAILGRLHLLHWLKRRPECGSPCQVCRSSCPIGAIKIDGAIDMNECFQCLDCQVDFSDNTVCPPLVARRKRADRLREPLVPVQVAQ
jgi:NosR/NirI family nitrous oxide reductase transcriptional regulator